MGRMLRSVGVVAKKGKVGASLKHSTANLKTKEKKQATPKKRKTYSRKSKLSFSLYSKGNGRSRSSKEEEEESSEEEQESSKEEEEEESSKEEEKEESSEEEEGETSTLPLAQIKKEYPCFACNKIFNKMQDLFDHTCNVKKEKGFMCKVCKKVYNRRSTYLTHQFIHSKAKPYKCGECQFKSATKSAHLYHMKREHPELQPFVCSYFPCDCSFLTHKELVSHHKMVHNANRCKYCDKRFDTNSKLLRHKYNDHERYFLKKGI